MEIVSFKKPKVSVVITAFDNTEYLDYCLASVFGQNCSLDFEVLLGIDGCPKTLEYFKTIQHEYPIIKAYYMTKNVGTYITTNTLIQLSKGEYIIRFDSDDTMLRGMLCDFSYIASENNIVGFPALENGKKKTKLTHGCMGFHKSLFFDLNGFKSWRVAADSDFIERAKKIGIKRVLVPSPSFVRTIHPNSLTQSRGTGYRSQMRVDLRPQIGKLKTTQIETADFIQISGSDSVI